MSRRELVSRYFGTYVDKFDLNQDHLRIGAFEFRVRAEKLEVTAFPQEPFFNDAKKQMSEEGFLWHCVAYLKVRHFRTANEVLSKARTGEIYDEDYFMRRGGGGPYVGYPKTVYGADLRDVFRPFAQELFKRFLPHRSLDLGCATGILVRELQELGVDAEGIDISEWCVKNAVTSGITKGNVLDMSYEDQRFDLVTSQDVMEHLQPDDVVPAIKEQVRVTRDGGIICHFIPFYESDEPFGLDVHLCNASRAWWLSQIAKVPEIFIEQIAPDDNQWDFSSGILSRYFIFRVKR